MSDITEVLKQISDETVALHLAAYSRGDEDAKIMPGSESWAMLDLLTGKRPPRCAILLGRAVINGEVETFGGTYPMGYVKEDHVSPNGVWSTRTIPKPDIFSYLR